MYVSRSIGSWVGCKWQVSDRLLQEEEKEDFLLERRKTQQQPIRCPKLSKRNREALVDQKAGDRKQHCLPPLPFLLWLSSAMGSLQVAVITLPWSQFLRV